MDTFEFAIAMEHVNIKTRFQDSSFFEFQYIHYIWNTTLQNEYSI